MAITNPLQTDPEKKCEDKNHRDDNIDTALYIRGTGIVRLCTSCITDEDEPLNKNSRKFVRRRLLPDHNRR